MCHTAVYICHTVPRVGIANTEMCEANVLAMLKEQGERGGESLGRRGQSNMENEVTVGGDRTDRLGPY